MEGYTEGHLMEYSLGHPMDNLESQQVDSSKDHLMDNLVGNPTDNHVRHHVDNTMNPMQE